MRQISPLQGKAGSPNLCKALISLGEAGAALWCLCRDPSIPAWGGWKGPLWVTQPNPLPKQGHPEQSAQHRGQGGWNISREGDSPTLWAAWARAPSPQREEVLPRLQLELPLPQFVPVAPCPVAGHHCKESGPILLTPLQILIGISKVPSQPSLLQAEQAQLPQPLLAGEMLQSPPHPPSPALDSLQ